MNISHAIMAHPARERFVADLLDGELADVRVVWDEHGDRWDTGRRSMLAYDPAATWHVVTQDDSIPCRDFRAGITAALAAVPPDRPVAFYTGRVRPAAVFVERIVRNALVLQRRWLEFSGPWWGPCVAVPTHLIDGMVAWGDEHTNIPNYDKRMSAYFDTFRTPCWYSLPSLVDHRVGPENPSLVPGRGNAPSRTAFAYIGDASPLDIDWHTPPCTARDRAPGVQQSRRSASRTWRHRDDGRTRTCVIGSDSDRRYERFDEWEVVA